MNTKIDLGASTDVAAGERRVWPLGNDLPVNRIGFGAAGIVGPNAWGPPEDKDHSIRLLRRAVEEGVNFIDTADAHGPQLAEQLIREALWPYPEGLVIGTKAGMTRGGPHVWGLLGRPEYLAQSVELSLRHLGVERIDLFQLHRVDPKVPADEQFGALAELQQAGKIRHLGLSEVSVEQVAAARAVFDVVSVQNRYNLADRTHEAVLDEATRLGIAFIPWTPFGAGHLAKTDGPLQAVATRLGVSTAQLNLAWLLHRSPVLIPIPGTENLDHLVANVAAADIELSAADFAEIDQIGLSAEGQRGRPNYTI